MQSTPSPDQLLVRKCKDGDRGAFEVLVIKYHRQIINLCSRLTGDRDTAEDLAQEIFLKAYKALSDFKEDSSFYTWVYRIAVNTSLSHRSSSGTKMAEAALRESDSTDDGPAFDHPSSDQTPEENILRKELGGKIMQALEGLGNEFRTTLILREIDGLSYEEIAEVLDLPVGTVRSRIFRSREELKKKLSNYVGR